MSMATRITAAMSMPNLVAAPPMKANWVASVIVPRAEAPEAPKVLEISTFVPNVAATKITSPAMF